MSAAAPFEFYVNKRGTATLLAYIEGNDGTPITQAGLTAIAYTISLVDEHDTDDDSTTVTNHVDVALVVADTIFDTQQTSDVRWNTADHENKGYNFKHLIDIDPDQAFVIRGRRYRVRVKFTPATGQVFWAEWLPAVR